MGYSLPASIGYSTSTSMSSIAIIGDGGLALCLSELSMLEKHKLPILVVVLDNYGHSIQRQTIETWLECRYTGVSTSDDLPSINIKKIATSFGLNVFTKLDDLLIDSSIQILGPSLLYYMIPLEERCFPNAVFGQSLHNPLTKTAVDP